GMTPWMCGVASETTPSGSAKVIDQRYLTLVDRLPRVTLKMPAPLVGLVLVGAPAGTCLYVPQLVHVAGESLFESPVYPACMVIWPAASCCRRIDPTTSAAVATPPVRVANPTSDGRAVAEVQFDIRKSSCR